jgi:hypothetical protein
MITCLAIGDPHFKVSNIRETDEMVAKVVSLAKSRQPTFIVVMGDVLDRHETIHVSPLERATDFMRQLRAIAPLYVLIGNHDRPNNSNFLTSEHPFNALKDWPNTTIVDCVIRGTIQNRTFLWVPYVPPGRFMEALDTLEPDIPVSLDQLKLTESDQPPLPAILNGITALFAHQEFRGAKMGAIVSAEGDEWPLFYPPVFSGHIHDYDELQPNLYYTGTPMQHAFGDRDDKTVSWITWPNPRTKEFIHERIDLELTKKIQVTLNCTDIATYVPPPNRLVKVILTGTSAEIKAAMKFANIKTLMAAGVKISPKALPSDPTVLQRDVSLQPLSYSQRLYQAVSADPELTALYHRLFAGPPKTGLTAATTLKPPTQTIGRVAMPTNLSALLASGSSKPAAETSTESAQPAKPRRKKTSPTKKSSAKAAT